ncbi:MAG: GspE/PulE family protein [Patescibacteria group bacterium]
MIVTEAEIHKLLIETKILDEKGWNNVVDYAENCDIRIYDAIIEKNILSDEKLGILIANYLKLPFLILSKTTLSENLRHIVPERLARKYKVIPFERTKDEIRLAMANPKETHIPEMISQKTGQKVATYLSTPRDIDNALRIYRRDLQLVFKDIITREIEGQGRVENEAPIARMVDLLIIYAYQDKASDIHIEPEEKNVLVRFRIDGVLHDILVLPKNMHDRIITRIKVLASLRTDEHMASQDGKLKIRMNEEDLDVRVSILPIVDGEKVVLRLFSTRSRQYSLLNLGMGETDLRTVTNAFSKSYGMILSTGPTGSGKSTSIYSILKLLNTREKNITTIEDPVEYRIKGINQIQVNAKANLTFAAGLRSILRQDPNVVFVGEIRDMETAGIAVNAALTGHLVLSTLHTNDAATALPRLIDMKIEPFLVASTVNVIVAQRLIRRICEMCRTSITMSYEELSNQIPTEILNKYFGQSKEIHVYKGAGCKICHMTGFSGRIGVFEVMEISKEIKKLITEKADSDVIAKQASAEGMTTMLEDGLDKVVKGLTSIEEVLRVTKVESL